MELKIHYSTLATYGNCSENIRTLLNGLPFDNICGIVLFCQEDKTGYHNMLKHFKSSLKELLRREIPVTLVPQPLLPKDGLCAEIYILDSVEDIEFNEGCGLIKTDDYSLIFIEGIASSDFSDGVFRQSCEVFERLDAILSKHGFCPDDIVRQWNYIGNITSLREGRQNYQEFNDARSEFYQKGKWTEGYPAATGIGASCDGIIVGCIAYKSVNAIYPINNPLQIAAHKYSKNVLVDNNVDAIKSTPKFERAKLIEIGNQACCFVSGTAAIRGEKSMDADSARSQTIHTIENIEYLVSKENLVKYGCKPYDLHYLNLRVYIKNAYDYEDVRSVVEERCPDIPTIYTIADVCRHELLVEIEGILTS
jgi:enamine deaminase RidA (YjgF/YER057c/UK114 family)